MARYTVLAATFAILLTASPALAQPDESDNRQSPGFEVGAGIAPWFLSYMDVEATHPPSVWATIPVRGFDVQIDYLRSVRRDPLWYLPFDYTDEHGQYVERREARTSHHVEQIFSAAVKWPRLGRRGYLLLGGAWQHYADRWCTAFTGSWPEGVRRVDFPSGFECSSTPADVVLDMLMPLYGVGWDLPLGSRFFGSVQYRARLIPFLGELRVGVGYRF